MVKNLPMNMRRTCEDEDGEWRQVKGSESEQRAEYEQ